MKTENMNVSNPMFIMLVGPPGVGKSTWCKDVLPLIVKGEEVVIISSDKYIEKVAEEQGKTYTEVFQSAIAYASESSKQDFKEALEKKVHIVWDQTNLSPKKRKGLLKQIPNEYFPTCVYWVIKDEAKWKKQLDRPGKFIPEHVLKSMLDNYVHPSFNEGWEAINKEIV